MAGFKGVGILAAVAVLCACGRPAASRESNAQPARPAPVAAVSASAADLRIRALERELATVRAQRDAALARLRALARERVQTSRPLEVLVTPVPAAAPSAMTQVFRTLTTSASP